MAHLGPSCLMIKPIRLNSFHISGIPIVYQNSDNGMNTGKRTKTSHFSCSFICLSQNLLLHQVGLWKGSSAHGLPLLMSSDINRNDFKKVCRLSFCTLDLIQHNTIIHNTCRNYRICRHWNVKTANMRAVICHILKKYQKVWPTMITNNFIPYSFKRLLKVFK